MFGVYLGQEYTALPSVRIIVQKTIEYFQVERDHQPDNITLYNQAINLLDGMIKRALGNPHQD